MRKHFKLWLRAFALAIVGVPLVSLASDLVTPNSFTAGTAIQSAQVNGNFAAVQTAVNSKQDLVTGACAAGSFIVSVNSDGTVTCAGTTFGLVLSGSSTTPGLSVTNNGTGEGILATQGSASATAPAVSGVSLSTAANAVGVYGEVSAAGGSFQCAGVKGENSTTNAPGYGVWGDDTGLGVGVYGTSALSTAVSGVSNGGVGVVGQGPLGGVLGISGQDTSPGVTAFGNSATGIALSITSGSLQVPGAGPGTQTTAYIHVASSGTLTGGGVLYRTILDNPLINGDPNAILIVTANYHASPVNNNHAVSLYYDSNLGSWEIYNVDGLAFTLNAAYNVLIIKTT